MREEDFSLDPTGNWTDYVQKTSGTTVLDQDRDHNMVNETSDITETTGPAWVTPVHDAAGNMTTVPKPADPTVGLTCTFDAWNRLARVEQSGSGVANKYEFDGLNRRIVTWLDSLYVDLYMHFYYNASWQVLEMRSTTGGQPESAQPDYQYVWSARYIDAPVLRDKNTDSDGLCDEGRIEVYQPGSLVAAGAGGCRRSPAGPASIRPLQPGRRSQWPEVARPLGSIDRCKTNARGRGRSSRAIRAPVGRPPNIGNAAVNRIPGTWNGHLLSTRHRSSPEEVLPGTERECGA